MHQDGFFKLIGQGGFIVRAEIIAFLDRRPEALQAQNRFIIGESRKGRDDLGATTESDIQRPNV